MVEAPRDDVDTARTKLPQDIRIARQHETHARPPSMPMPAPALTLTPVIIDSVPAPTSPAAPTVFNGTPARVMPPPLPGSVGPITESYIAFKHRPRLTTASCVMITHPRHRVLPPLPNSA